MMILLGNRGDVDFSDPVKMTYQQRNEFMYFLKTLFSVVEEELVDETRDERMGDRSFNRKWSEAEYEILLQHKTTGQISDELGRTWLSVNIKRGQFISEYFKWATDNEKDILNGDPKQLIKEFFADKKKVKNVFRKMKIEPKRTKPIKCPFCGCGIRGIVISDNEAKCRVCTKTFSITKEDIDKEDNVL